MGIPPQRPARAARTTLGVLVAMLGGLHGNGRDLAGDGVGRGDDRVRSLGGQVACLFPVPASALVSPRGGPDCAVRCCPGCVALGRVPVVDGPRPPASPALGLALVALGDRQVARDLPMPIPVTPSVQAWEWTLVRARGPGAARQPGAASLFRSPEPAKTSTSCENRNRDRPSVGMKAVPCPSHLYAGSRRNPPVPESRTDRAGRLFFAIPGMFRVSIVTVPPRLAMAVVTL